ncbi:MAG: hypothetical protein COA68_16765 [Oceanobacter sp.]|nr:MAG: hypothetical protein COA68_16765 [Oceanobacter sp.]
MEHRQLVHFLAVLDSGSLTAAAQRVGLTQQALSKSLSRLENELGGKLFERGTRGMTATRLGESISEYARDIIASAGKLRHTASAALGLERGRLVVGLSPISAASLLGKRLTQFAQNYPNVRIDVEGGIDRDFVAALHRGELDIALSSQVGGQYDGILLEQVFSEPWGVGGCVNNQALQDAQSISDLADGKWIIGRNTDLLDDIIAETFSNAGLPMPKPGIMTTSVLFSLHALSQSDFLAILPQSLCRDFNGILWRDLSDGAWISPIYMMRRRRAHMDELVSVLLRELKG